MRPHGRLHNVHEDRRCRTKRKRRLSITRTTGSRRLWGLVPHGHAARLRPHKVHSSLLTSAFDGENIPSRHAGTKDMGGWTGAIYTAEQQARLGVDEYGKKSPSKGIGPAWTRGEIERPAGASVRRCGPSSASKRRHSLRSDARLGLLYAIGRQEELRHLDGRNLYPRAATATWRGRDREEALVRVVERTAACCCCSPKRVTLESVRSR